MVFLKTWNTFEQTTNMGHKPRKQNLWVLRSYTRETKLIDCELQQNNLTESSNQWSNVFSLDKTPTSTQSAQSDTFKRVKSHNLLIPVKLFKSNKLTGSTNMIKDPSIALHW